MFEWPNRGLRIYHSHSHRNMATQLNLVFLSVILILGLSEGLKGVGVPKVGQYFLNWDGGMKPCEGTENKIFDLDKLVVEKKSKSVIALVGQAGLTRNTTNKVVFQLTIEKEINGNYEYQFTVKEPNLCDHISEQNKPWTPFVKEMGIKGCPIPKRVYSFKQSTLDTAGFPLTVAQEGNYRGKVEMFEEGKRTVCLIADASVQPL